MRFDYSPRIAAGLRVAFRLPLTPRTFPSPPTATSHHRPPSAHAPPTTPCAVPSARRTTSPSDYSGPARPHPGLPTSPGTCDPPPAHVDCSRRSTVTSQRIDYPRLLTHTPPSPSSHPDSATRAWPSTVLSDVPTQSSAGAARCIPTTPPDIDSTHYHPGRLASRTPQPVPASRLPTPSPAALPPTPQARTSRPRLITHLLDYPCLRNSAPVPCDLPTLSLPSRPDFAALHDASPIRSTSQHSCAPHLDMASRQPIPQPRYAVLTDLSTLLCSMHNEPTNHYSSDRVTPLRPAISSTALAGSNASRLPASTPHPTSLCHPDDPCQLDATLVISTTPRYPPATPFRPHRLRTLAPSRAEATRLHTPAPCRDQPPPTTPPRSRPLLPPPSDHPDFAATRAPASRLPIASPRTSAATPTDRLAVPCPVPSPSARLDCPSLRRQVHLRLARTAQPGSSPARPPITPRTQHRTSPTSLPNTPRGRTALPDRTHASHHTAPPTTHRLLTAMLRLPDVPGPLRATRALAD